jgi:cell wall-associated NlpC family hydrolase
MRDALVAAAEGWLGTAFHHAARVHGDATWRGGIDCINLLCAVYEEVGLIDHVDLPYYPADFMMHRSEERFLAGVLATKAREVPEPGPGDVALFRYGRCYSHGAIVTRWPLVIHAYGALGGVFRGDATKHPLLDGANKPRPVKFYSMLE